MINESVFRVIIGSAEHFHTMDPCSFKKTHPVSRHNLLSSIGKVVVCSSGSKLINTMSKHHRLLNLLHSFYLLEYKQTDVIIVRQQNIQSLMISTHTSIHLLKSGAVILLLQSHILI